jgi:hypothetical protein
MARVVLDEAALQVITRSPAGPVGVYMARGAQVVASAAKGLALVDTGKMKSMIDWQIGSDGDGIYADVSSPARSDRGYPYPLVIEFRYRSHLRDALNAWPG